MIYYSTESVAVYKYYPNESQKWVKLEDAEKLEKENAELRIDKNEYDKCISDLVDTIYEKEVTINYLKAELDKYKSGYLDEFGLTAEDRSLLTPSSEFMKMLKDGEKSQDSQIRNE